MTEWYCHKDKVKMLSTDVALKYMQLVQYCARTKMPAMRRGVSYRRCRDDHREGGRRRSRGEIAGAYDGVVGPGPPVYAPIACAAFPLAGSLKTARCIWQKAVRNTAIWKKCCFGKISQAL